MKKYYPVFSFSLWVLLALSFSPMHLSAGGNQELTERWVTENTMLEGRQEIYSAAAEGVLYVPGGVLNNGKTSQSLEAYLVAEKSWREMAQLPQPRHHITPAIVGNKLYAVGGFNGSYPNWVMKSENFVYDIENDSWSQGVSLPEPRGEHVAVVVDNKIHVIGGRAPGKEGKSHFDAYQDSAAHYVYSTEMGKWEKKRAAPTARNSAAAAVIDGLIYVVGGRQNLKQEDGKQLQHNLGALEVYNPNTDSWEILSSMPAPAGGIAAAALDGKLYVFGGEQWTPEKKVFNDVWVYDPKTDSWSEINGMLTARHGLAAAAIGDSIYVVGGCTKVGGGAVVGTTERLLHD